MKNGRPLKMPGLVQYCITFNNLLLVCDCKKCRTLKLHKKGEHIRIRQRNIFILTLQEDIFFGHRPLSG